MTTTQTIPRRRLLHMRISEIDLFRRFETMDPLAGPRYDFDVHLGRGMPLDPTWPTWLQAMARRLTQKRVDVIAHTKEATWILEIKPRSGPSAVGQLLTYLALYVEQFPTPQPVVVGIIADRNSYDMFPVYEALGIKLFLV